MVQALYHRDRTGTGQFVDTSIMYAHLLNASMAWDTPEGLERPPRPSLDRMQQGWSPWYRLYRSADGWVCVAAITQEQRAALSGLAGVPSTDDVAFDAFEPSFLSRSSVDWIRALDASGVPAEISDPDFVLRLFDDPEMIEKGWVASYDHPVVGRTDALGLLFDFSETPGVVQGPPFLVGQHSREILHELGVDAHRIDELIATGVVGAID